jgi:hypothetical protein
MWITRHFKTGGHTALRISSTGPRFGSLVHLILKNVDFAAQPEAITRLALGVCVQFPTLMRPRYVSATASTAGSRARHAPQPCPRKSNNTGTGESRTSESKLSSLISMMFLEPIFPPQQRTDMWAANILWSNAPPIDRAGIVGPCAKQRIDECTVAFIGIAAVAGTVSGPTER